MTGGGRTGLRRRLAGVALAALALAVAPAPVGAQSAPTASDVKAAYLLKFGAFVDWPAQANAETSPMILCIVGRDPVANLIARQAAGVKVGARPLRLRRLQQVTAEAGCHIAYIGGSAEQTVADGVRALAGAPVLTVTDSEHGDARGMIHFALQQSRVKFHIDSGAATRGGLTLSSKLLALALSVKP